MSDYTPTTEQVREAWSDRYSSEWGFAYREETEMYDAEFDRWLAQHDAEVAEKEKQRIVAAIFDEQQRLLEIQKKDPTNPHLTGIGRGLYVARDIAEGEQK